jgi:hypothetical protein
MVDAYTEGFQGLVEIHRKIAGAFEAAIARPAEVPLAQGAASFLLAHHTMESEILFPALRRAGRRRSVDCAFIDPLDRAHHELHGMAERLLQAGPSSAGSLAKATLEMLLDHVAEEEVGLAPDRMKLLVTLDDMAQIQRDADAMRDRMLKSVRT